MFILKISFVKKSFVLFFICCLYIFQYSPCQALENKTLNFSTRSTLRHRVYLAKNRSEHSINKENSICDELVISSEPIGVDRPIEPLEFKINWGESDVKIQKVAVFIHVCTIGFWEEVLGEQLDRIKRSGLYDFCSSINLGILGTGDMTPLLLAYPKINILFQQLELSLYERSTLLTLHTFYKKILKVEFFIYILKV